MNGRLLVAIAASFASSTTWVGAQSNVVISAFADGQITWTNVDSNLYYTVEWQPGLGGTAPWTGAYHGVQDVQSTNDTVTVLVPMVFRVVGSSNRTYKLQLSPDSPLVAEGYYAATNLTLVDPDLVASNIRAGVEIFGVFGELHRVGNQPLVTIDFTAMGTFTAPLLENSGVSITASQSPGVSGTLNLLNLNGLGVVGGVFSDSIDTSEGVRIDFYPLGSGPAFEVIYIVGSAGNQNGNGTAGDAFVEGFGVSGGSLGIVPVSGTGEINVSALFGNEVLSAFEIRANVDGHRIGSMQYRSAQCGTVP